MLEVGEHVGTHFDAPIHWITGRDGEDVASVPPARLVGPAVVIDKSAEAAEDPDYLLTVADVRAFGAEHGPLPAGGWLLLRTGWDARAHDQEAFLNGAHTPGPDAECARWLAEETPIVGHRRRDRRAPTRASAGGFEPPFPVHSYFLGAGKYGVTQLANLAELPPTGAVVVVAPLKLVDGTGSPARVLALVPPEPRADTTRRHARARLPRAAASATMPPCRHQTRPIRHRRRPSLRRPASRGSG